MFFISAYSWHAPMLTSWKWILYPDWQQNYRIAHHRPGLCYVHDICFGPIFVSMLIAPTFQNTGTQPTYPATLKISELYLSSANKKRTFPGIRPICTIYIFNWASATAGNIYEATHTLFDGRCHFPIRNLFSDIWWREMYGVMFCVCRVQALLPVWNSFWICDTLHIALQKKPPYHR